MSELGKANETSMGLPRSGGSSCTTVTSQNITSTPPNSSPPTTNINNNNIEGNDKNDKCSSACRRSNSTGPRGEKRPWDGISAEQGATEGEPPSKLVCTSPPHALCAEDVPQQPHQPIVERLGKKQYRSSSNNSGNNSSSKSSLMVTDDLLPVEATCGVSDESDTDAEIEDERDFLDEEDKDSGFIDSHSIDNSSDDDMDVRLTPVVAISSTNNNNIVDSCSSDLSEVQIYCTLQTSTRTPCVSSDTQETSDSTTRSSIENPAVASTVSNSATILPSCSSAFYAYSSLSSNFVPSSSPIGSVDRSSHHSSFNQSSCSSSPVAEVHDTPANNQCASNVESSIAQSSSQNSIVSSSNSTSVSISEVLSTSIALSVDVMSSAALPSLNCCGIVDSASDNLVQSISAVSVTNSPTLPSLLHRDYHPSSADLSNNMSTIASANADTIVTSAYSGTVSSPLYDPHAYQLYSAEVSPRTSSAAMQNGSWSCNFYDGNQPTMTNKYMEIQTSKIGGVCATPPPSPSQAIQCDANGKSYMDLGSASPFTQTYSADCGNYTTSPSSNFSGVIYNNQTCSNSNNYSQQQQAPQQTPNNQFYRPGYSQFGGFPSGEGCSNNYDGDVGCSYGYPPNYPPSRPLKMMPPRCASPFCDPSKPSSMRSPCYQQQRLAVLNMSMCKLNRFSRCSDPRLHKSVLICNTLRLIEKEFESEGTSMNAILLSQQHMMHAGLPPHCPPPPPTPPPMAMSGGSSEGPLPSMHPPIISSPMPGPCTPPPVLPPPIMPPYNGSSIPYRGPLYPDGAYEDLRGYSPLLECEPLPASDNPTTLHNLRPSSSAVLEQSSLSVLSNVGGILPCNNNNNNNNNSGNLSSNNFTSSNETSCSSSISSQSSTEDRAEGAINWCSVLSLPSQSDLDSLNSSDFCEWGSENSMEIEYSTNSSSSCNSSPARSSTSASSTTTSGLTEVSSASQYKLDLPSLSADDVLKSFPDQPRRIEPSDELDNLIDVLVES
ncbi:dentin sialophosphoprotein [Hyalella azteca]|uniref:Dentin sialophosphoprotein n=1 Tax=Hyalella azteca TaxID=294128 RepID=A0A8B7MZF2_HYAAZ|nr:dentin sialophosphoprotein [Hyalella azteca]